MSLISQRCGAKRFIISSFGIYAPSVRVKVPFSSSKSESPRPSKSSAPVVFKMVIESVGEETLYDKRVGKFALMTPVITSTDGRCVAIIRWIPEARDFWAKICTCFSTFLSNRIKSANSSIIQTIYGILLPFSMYSPILRTISFSNMA